MQEITVRIVALPADAATESEASEMFATGTPEVIAGMLRQAQRQKDAGKWRWVRFEIAD